MFFYELDQEICNYFFLQYKNSVSAEVMRNTLHICSANTEFFNQSNNL